MNDQPISQSKDADLRGVDAALRRAAKRARERARMTNTRLVLSRGGIIEYVVPGQPRIGEQNTHYDSE